MKQGHRLQTTILHLTECRNTDSIGTAEWNRALEAALLKKAPWRKRANENKSNIRLAKFKYFALLHKYTGNEIPKINIEFGQIRIDTIVYVFGYNFRRIRPYKWLFTCGRIILYEINRCGQSIWLSVYIPKRPKSSSDRIGAKIQRPYHIACNRSGPVEGALTNCFSIASTWPPRRSMTMPSPKRHRTFGPHNGITAAAQTRSAANSIHRRTSSTSKKN